MNNKLSKTREELASLITERLKSRPECAEVTGVAIAHVVKIANDRPNWHAAFTTVDKRAVPPVARQIVGELASRFDLI